MEVKIKTLTPLWTGGVEGKVDHIHETGILGSLRWWMEVLVRGLGGSVCDPDSTELKCLYDPKKPNNDLCKVCEVFGATGRKRRFRLNISNIEETFTWKNPLKITPQGRTRGWYLNPGWIGKFTLNLHGDSETLAKLYTLLRFIEIYGSLSARPQLGYGVFRIVDIKNRPECKSPCFVEQENNQQSLREFPDLRAFTFFKLRFTPRKSSWWYTVPGLKELRTNRNSWAELEKLAQKGMIPTTPALKNYLRYHHQWSSPALPHWLFGTIRYEERLRSKVVFSWAYHLENTDEWEIRGWMYLPQDRNGQVFRHEIVRVFQEKLGESQTWLTALGLESTDYSVSKLTLLPSQNSWQIHLVADIQAFLKDTLQEHNYDS